MEELIAPIFNDIKFDIEKFLDEQIGAQPLPFPGMDKSGSATCVFHMKGICERGSMCPFRHFKPDRTVVCKHWLRGLCKKGDSCEFLHEYNMSKMPECYFYSKFRACTNKECPFLHIDPETKIKDCPWYDRGFCRHGPNCRHRHTRRVACINYLCGFCPDGSNCKLVHVRFDIPTSNTSSFNANTANNSSDTNQTTTKTKSIVICHYCNEIGHKIYTCQKIPQEQKELLSQKYQFFQDSNHENKFQNTNQNTFHHSHHHQQQQQQQNNTNPNQNANANNANNANTNNDQGIKQHQPHYRPLDQVTCFKCGEKGHYANKCPKGYLAFLSPALKDLHLKRNSQANNNNNNNTMNNNNNNNNNNEMES